MTLTLTKDDFVGKMTPYGVIRDVGHPHGARGKPFETFSFRIQRPTKTDPDGTCSGETYTHSGYSVIFWMRESGFENGALWFDWFWAKFKGVAFETEIEGDEMPVKVVSKPKRKPKPMPFHNRLPGF